MTIKYLWKSRVKHNIFSFSWCKIWTKRLLQFLPLVRILCYRFGYKVRGAQVGELSIIRKLVGRRSLKGLQVGHRSYIGRNVHCALHANIIIGDCVCINDNVHFLTGSHSTRDCKWPLVSKSIEVKDYVWIAYNVLILPGVTIGRGAVVGAGAVVSKDVPDYAIVVGNPAYVVGNRCTDFQYDPVSFCAPFEAWTGTEINNGM